MSEDEFNKYKYSLIAVKEERARNLSDEMIKFWTAIQSGYCDFMRDLVDGQILRATTLDELREFYLAYIHPLSKYRRKISVWSHAKGPLSLKVSPEAIESFCGGSDALKVLFQQAPMSELLTGGTTLSLALKRLRSALEQCPGQTKSTIDDLAFHFIRCVRRYTKDKEYEYTESESDIPIRTFVNAKEFKESLPISNFAYRVVMPLKPPAATPPSRI